MKPKIITKEFFAYLSFGLFAIILIYLLLQRFGILHSFTASDAIIGVVIAQGFYNGYAFRAFKDIDRQLREIREQLKGHETRLRKIEGTLGI